MQGERLGGLRPRHDVEPLQTVGELDGQCRVLLHLPSSHCTRFSAMSNVSRRSSNNSRRKNGLTPARNKGPRSIAMSRSETLLSAVALTLAGQAVSFGAISRKSLSVR